MTHVKGGGGDTAFVAHFDALKNIFALDSTLFISLAYSRKISTVLSI
jgi:hypothetical protein